MIRCGNRAASESDGRSGVIVERLTFRGKFGQGEAVVAAFKRFNVEIAPQHGFPAARIMVDTTGSMFTVAVEQSYADLAKLAAQRVREEELYGTDLFREWFA